MKALLKLEDLAQFILALYLFSLFSYSWLTFTLLLFTPDFSMIGYLVNSKVGAFTYNLVHHKATGIIFYIVGIHQSWEMVSLIGIILFAHTTFDRVWGYGLKYSDSFQNTHLGKIGL